LRLLNLTSRGGVWGRRTRGRVVAGERRRPELARAGKTAGSETMVRLANLWVGVLHNYWLYRNVKKRFSCGIPTKIHIDLSPSNLR